MKRTVAPAPHLRRVGLVVAIAGFAAIAFATLSPQAGTATGSHLCLVCGPLGGVNSLLNVFLFMPFGFGLALSGFSGKRAVLVACAFSALIELAQLLVIPGRYATIGDVITNTMGGAFGFAVGSYWFALLRPSRRIALTLSICWCGIWLLIQVIASYGFHPSIPRADYYGQIGPKLGDFVEFKGRVVRASVGNLVVPNARFEASDGLRDLLLHGATFRSTIVLSEPISGVAPIVRVADAREREVVLLAQDSADLVFGVRTGASALRLRPPMFALRDVMPDIKPRDGAPIIETLEINARYTAREAWLHTQSSPTAAVSTTKHDDHLPITASLGWTLLMPFQWLIEGTGFERAATFAWLAALLFPLGYWGAALAGVNSPRQSDRTSIIAALIAAVALYVGLILVPHIFELAPTPTGDWIAAIAGIAAGGALCLKFQPDADRHAIMQVGETHLA